MTQIYRVALARLVPQLESIAVADSDPVGASWGRLFRWFWGRWIGYSR